MHEAAKPGLRTVSSKDCYFSSGISPAGELILSSAPQANEKVLPDGMREVAKILTDIKARRPGGLLEKLECTGFGEKVKVVLGGVGGLSVILSL